MYCYVCTVHTPVKSRRTSLITTYQCTMPLTVGLPSNLSSGQTRLSSSSAPGVYCAAESAGPENLRAPQSAWRSPGPSTQPGQSVGRGGGTGCEPGVGAGGFHEFGATDAFAGQGSRRGSVGVFRERSSAGGSNFQLFANLGDPRKTFLCLHLCVVCACVSVSV
jgi:hypothetical protein